MLSPEQSSTNHTISPNNKQYLQQLLLSTPINHKNPAKPLS